MLKLPDLIKGFKALRELDLSAIRDEADATFHIAVLGETGVGKSTLISQLLSGPRSGGAACSSSVTEHRLDGEILLQPCTTAILVLDAGRTEKALDYPILEKLRSNKVPIVVCYNKSDLTLNPQVVSSKLFFPGSRAVALVASDRQKILENLIPELLHIYRGREVLLARHLPMLREPVSRRLIEDTCQINAAYSLTTGLAEMNILLDLPLNAADMAVLTKNQAFMAYKIALAFDLPSDWRETMPKLATVVGSGFLWRLIARQLIGLVPAFGIIPKVAVSYAGTYAVGQAVYQWCANNEKVKPERLQSIFKQALEHGRGAARTLVEKGNTA